MTTEDRDPASGPDAKHLTDMILKGDEEQAAQSAEKIYHHKGDVNDIVDTISDAMNIVADLHEVERYSIEQVESAERAAEKALQAIRPNLRVEQTKVSGRVMVASLERDPHSFDKTLLLAMLEIGGFTPLDGGDDLSPRDVVDKVEELKPDVLAIPLVTDSAAKNLAEAASLLEANAPRPHIVAYGRGAGSLPAQEQLGVVEEDSLGALSRIAELLISKG